MKIFSIVIASVVLAACQKSPPDAAPEEKKPEAAEKHKREPGVVVVNAAAQKKGGVLIQQLEPRNVAGTIAASGQLAVNEDRTWHVGATTDGKIDELTAKVGDTVRSGAILARIHTHEVHEARAGYKKSIVELERAKMAHGYATRLADRAKRLFDLKAGSRQDVDSAEAEVRNAQAVIDKAQAELGKERAHLEFLHVPIEDLPSEKNHDPMHDDVPIFAPASGLVVERKASVGSVVTAGDRILSITDPANLWMIAAANESDLSKLRAGQSVRVSVRAYPDREFRGRILKLGEQLDPTTRTLQVRILVANSQGLLKPEMFATAAVELPSTRSSLFIPEAAIQDINGVPAVFVQRAGDQFEPRPIKTGGRMNGEVEILEGLKAGDSVVVKGSFLLKSQLLKSTLEEE
ncbi:MAG TPA: efflux RND transporter periplasmic adaptor subunit [Bryobacteraceae bacterium]|nr:efflux RND transporter periplasmic adaptor subunit [Bryobacteraceae bacterium]